MKTIEDLDQGTIRRIDWQELLPGVLFFRALVLAFRVGPAVLGTLMILLMMALTGKSPVTRDFSVLLFKSLVCPFSCSVGAVSLGTALYTMTVILVWLFLARRGAMRLVTTRRVPIPEAVKFTADRCGSLFLAAAIPMIGLSLCILFLGLGGHSRWFFTGGLPVFQAAAWLAVLIGAGLLIGLPMMAAAVAVDRCDGFDAFSRTFSYIFQRPFHTLGYLILAVFFGAVGFFILRGLTLALAAVVEFFNLTGVAGDALISNSLWSLFWWSAAVMLPYGFVFSYICYAGTALYLVLRKNLDGTAFDRIYTESDGRVHRLRPILRDSEGAPEFAGGPENVPEPEKAGPPQDAPAQKNSAGDDAAEEPQKRD